MLCSAVVGGVVHQINRNKKESSSENKFDQNETKQSDTFQCKKCNRKHKPRQCPAFGKQFIKCNQMNHFAVCCNKKSVSCIDNFDTNNEIFYINMITNEKEKKWVQNLKIEDSFIEVKLDTGCEVNMLPYTLFKKIKPQNKINPTKGECFLECFYNNKVSNEKFLILNENYCSILGAEAIDNLGIVKKVNRLNAKSEENLTKENFIEMNSDVFNGVGSFPGKY